MKTTKKAAKGSVKNGLYKRGDNWYIRIMVNGTLCRKSFGTDKDQAELMLLELKKQRQIGRLPDDWTELDKLTKKRSTKTFAEAAEEYLKQGGYKNGGLKPSTVSHYQTILKCYLLPEFGKLPVSKISEGHIADFQARISNTKIRKTAETLSARRVNTVMQPLRSILQVSARRGVIANNPAVNVEAVDEPETNIDPLDKEELDLALANVDPFYRPIFTCLAWTGARPNEITALRWNDIDERRKEIKISKGRVRGNEGLPKTKAANRIIPIFPPVEEALQELKDRGVKNFDGYVFLNKDGKPIDRHLARIWERALRKAKLRHRPSYQLRHTFASICLQEGAAPGWLSKVLGHGSMAITFRYYFRYIESADKENERKIASMFDCTQKPTQVIALTK